METGLLSHAFIGLSIKDLEALVLRYGYESSPVVPWSESTISHEASVHFLDRLFQLKWRTLINLDFFIFSTSYELVRLTLDAAA